MSTEDEAAVEAGSAILGLYYWPQAADTDVSSSPTNLLVTPIQVNDYIHCTYTCL